MSSRFIGCGGIFLQILGGKERLGRGRQIEPRLGKGRQGSFEGRGRQAERHQGGERLDGGLAPAGGVEQGDLSEQVPRFERGQQNGSGGSGGGDFGAPAFNQIQTVADLAFGHDRPARGILFFAQAGGQFLQQFGRQVSKPWYSRQQLPPPLGGDDAGVACFVHINGLVKVRAKPESNGMRVRGGTSDFTWRWAVWLFARGHQRPRL
jgi:hypothetical protein